MKLLNVLLLSFSLLCATLNSVHATDNIMPRGVATLEDVNARYSVVLFHYFKGDYQQALKELSLVKQSTLSRDQKTTHQYFNNILLLSNGDNLSPSTLLVDNDSASMQAILLAIDEHIKINDWSSAQQFFDALPASMPKTLVSQHAYLQAQLSLHHQQDQTFNDARNKLDKQSQYYALLLQQKSTVKLVSEASVAENVNQLLAITDPQFINIKNKGLLAQGYRYLSMNDPQRAVGVFKNISLDSLNNNAASLGLGVALNELESFDRARQLLSRVLVSGDPGALYFEAALANAYALEKLGNEQQAYAQLTTSLERAKQRKANFPVLKQQLAQQSQCVINLLTNVLLNTCELSGEELNEQLLLLLSTQSFIEISDQWKTLVQLELQYNQQLQTVASFEYLLSHQVTSIEALLNANKIELLENELADTTAQRVVIVTDVDKAEADKSGQFFLSSHYLMLQKRIDKVFNRMVFLKRAGQHNTASERRVTLMQRIVWWHSFSNFTKHVNETKQQIDVLNNQLTDNNYAYQILQDYLAKVSGMKSQLSEISRISEAIHRQQAMLPPIKTALIERVSVQFNQFINEQQQALDTFIVNAELARVRIEDASFNRALAKEEGTN